MPWVEFTKDYDERVSEHGVMLRHVRAHKAGTKAMVRTSIAEHVEKLRAGKRLDRKPDDVKSTKDGRTALVDPADKPAGEAGEE